MSNAATNIAASAPGPYNVRLRSILIVLNLTLSFLHVLSISAHIIYSRHPLFQCHLVPFSRLFIRHSLASLVFFRCHLHIRRLTGGHGSHYLLRYQCCLLLLSHQHCVHLSILVFPPSILWLEVSPVASTRQYTGACMGNRQLSVCGMMCVLYCQAPSYLQPCARCSFWRVRSVPLPLLSAHTPPTSVMLAIASVCVVLLTWLLRCAVSPVLLVVSCSRH